MITALTLAALLQASPAAPVPAQTSIGPTLDQVLNYDVNKSPHINPAQLPSPDGPVLRPAKEPAIEPDPTIAEKVRADALVRATRPKR